LAAEFFRPPFDRTHGQKNRNFFALTGSLFNKYPNGRAEKPFMPNKSQESNQ